MDKSPDDIVMGSETPEHVVRVGDIIRAVDFIEESGLRKVGPKSLDELGFPPKKAKAVLSIMKRNGFFGGKTTDGAVFNAMSEFTEDMVKGMGGQACICFFMAEVEDEISWVEAAWYHDEESKLTLLDKFPEGKRGNIVSGVVDKILEQLRKICG